MTTDLRSVKNLYGLMLCIGLVQVSLYYLAGVSVTGTMSVAQPDTLLYCQAARRICEGHAFSFAAGVPVSTGTTSVLYPFVLAIPYALGCTGDALFLAGFLLNAAFYLVFLYGWALVIDRLLVASSSRLLAGIVVAAFGQTAFSALAQSDIGLWLALSALMVAALVRGKTVGFSLLLLISPWVRPEGMMFVLAFGAVHAFCILRRRRRLVSVETLVLILGALSSLGVFAFNYALTGAAQFSSVAHKGHLADYPLAAAVAHSAADMLSILKSYVLTLPAAGFRETVMLPVLGGALLWIGVFAGFPAAKTDGKGVSFGGIVVLVAAALSLVSVATGGWQGTNADRYLAWMMPILLVFMARGAEYLSERIQGPWAKWIPSVLLAAFTVGAAFVTLAHFRMASEVMAVKVAFADRCEATMTRKSAVATLGECGVAYRFSPRPVRHLYGIYTPTFEGLSPAELVDFLKYEKESRFYYWLFNDACEGRFLNATLTDAVTEKLVEGPSGLSLRKVRWNAFDAAAEPPAAPVAGAKLVARVDVGYAPDERAADYELYTDYHLPVPRVFATAGTCGGKTLAESGRVVFGGEAFSVALTPGRDAQVVLRTMRAASYVTLAGYDYASRTVAYENPMELHLEVNDVEVGHVTFRLNEHGFTDAVFKIPGSAITTSPCRVSLHGDHIACGYWFYQ